MIKKFNSNNITVFAILGPFILSVFLGILNIGAPTELSVYLLVIIAIIVEKAFFGEIKLNRFNDRNIMNFIFFIIIFTFYVLLNISNKLSIQKMNSFFYLIVLKVIIYSLIDYKYMINNYSDFLLKLKFMATFILIFYSMAFFLGFVEGFGNGSRVILVGIGNPIWFSRFVADLIFIILFVSLVKKKFKIIDIAVIIFGLFLLYKSGSRGPFLSMSLTFLFLLLKIRKKDRKKIITVILLCSISFLPFLVVRMLNYNIFSVYARINAFYKSFQFVINNPLGYGIGSFGFLYTGTDMYTYPHNIFAEILVEMGVFGFVFFLIIIILGLKTYSKYNLFFYLFVMAFMNAQLSGDLPGNSYMFLYLFISFIFKRKMFNFQIKNKMRFYI